MFAASRGSGPINGFSKMKIRLDKLSGVTGWVLHDLRRTARSLMSRAGIASEVAELVLGHQKEGVEGVYDRHTYDSEKRIALAKLAALVDGVVNPRPDNVVSLESGADRDVRRDRRRAMMVAKARERSALRRSLRR